MLGKKAGLNATPEDLKWLNVVDTEGQGAVPAYNQSRLVALGLAKHEAKVLQISERGKAVLTGGLPARKR